MTPIYQKGTHDCFRACLASILNLGWLDVPDFYEGVHDGQYLDEAGRSAMDKWFAESRLCYFELAYPMEPSDLVTAMNDVNPHLTFILMGNSLNGFGHSVIARGGEIIHDPAHSSPSTTSVARRCSDGYTRAGFVALRLPDFP